MPAPQTPQGSVADSLEGVDSVEIKATIPEQQIDAALAAYRLELDAGDESSIYFFDTPDLAGFNSGVIARARRRVGEDHDSTIKFRPVTPSKVPSLWTKYKGFKIEADASETKTVVSASLTMKVERKLIKRVAAGEAAPAILFTEEQQKFLLALADRSIDYANVVTLGPIRAWKWRRDDPGIPWRLTAELWEREDGERLLETSIKVPVAQAAVALPGFTAFLRDRNAQPDDCQQAKTHWALDYYAMGLAKAR